VRKLFGIVGAVVSLVVASGSGAVDAQDARPAGDGSRVPPDETIAVESGEDIVRRTAAEAIVEKYGVEMEEALRRYDLQNAQFDVVAQLEAAVGPEAWGGAYIDHEQGGQLVVQATDEAALTRAVAAVSSGDVPVITKKVPRSVAALETVSDQLFQRAETSDTRVGLHVNVVDNVVDVAPIAADGASRTRSSTDIDALIEGNEGQARPVASVAEPVPMSCSGTYQYCDEPLRGGVVVYQRESGSGFCTTGFNVVSTVDLKSYVLTAGHCLAELNYSNTWITRMPKDGALHTIGVEHNYVYFGYDAGIISVENVPGWRPDNHVLVRNSDGPYPTNANQFYPIHGVGNAGTISNGFLCKTGAVTATTCGQFEGGNWDFPGELAQNLGRVKMASCQGDSGAPIYVGNRGYGVFVLGEKGFQATVWPGIGNSTTVWCGGVTYYQGLAGALDFLNVALRT
jgi:Trypsin